MLAGSTNLYSSNLALHTCLMISHSYLCEKKLRRQVQKTFVNKKNEKYVGMKAEKVWRQGYHTHYKVDTTQSAICVC